MKTDIEAIAAHFRIPGLFIGGEPFGSGHIHDTYVLTYDQDGTATRYLLQQINHAVFRDPAALMENVRRITDHLRKKLHSLGEEDLNRKVLSCIFTHEDYPYYRNDRGNYWRALNFIEGAYIHETLKIPEIAYEIAKAFGFFQKMLLDFPGSCLHETIPDFHNTPKRLQVFEEAVETDPCERVASVKKEIEFAFDHRSLADLLIRPQEKGELPVRIVHNDAKITNVMLDNATGKGLVVIDLDTVMPGTILYDFGDMVRTATCPVEEDETDLSKVNIQMPFFEAVVHGYLESAGNFLTNAEKQYLTSSGKVIAFEQGIRFLTDYLSGDIYYRIHYRDQNLDRCRTQFKIVESIVAQEDRMEHLVEKLLLNPDEV